jgi:hypothetical protein
MKADGLPFKAAFHHRWNESLVEYWANFNLWSSLWSFLCFGSDQLLWFGCERSSYTAGRSHVANYRASTLYSQRPKLSMQQTPTCRSINVDSTNMFYDVAMNEAFVIAKPKWQ